MATLRDTWREDIIWHVKGAGQLYGDYHGPDEVFGLLGKFAEETGGTFRLDVHAILAGDGVLGSHHRPGPQLWTSGSSCWATVTQPAGRLCRAQPRLLRSFWGATAFLWQNRCAGDAWVPVC